MTLCPYICCSTNYRQTQAKFHQYVLKKTIFLNQMNIAIVNYGPHSSQLNCTGCLCHLDTYASLNIALIVTITITIIEIIYTMIAFAFPRQHLACFHLLSYLHWSALASLKIIEHYLNLNRPF